MSKFQKWIFFLNVLWLFFPNAYATCIGLNCTCSVSATPVGFGVYDPTNTSPTISTGTVSVTCGADVLGGLISYTITFNAGSSGNFTTRTMLNGSYALSYNLYTDGTYTTVWGDTTGGTSDVTDNYLLQLFSPTTRNYTVYGQMPINQRSAAGSYTDTITATVTF